MLTTPCQSAFKAGLKQRLAHPLPSGAYKLRDAHREITRMMTTMEAIGDHLRLPPSRRAVTINLGGCTTEDRATYLKNIPTDVAINMGWAVMPAIIALTEDGLSEAEAKSVRSEAETRISRLLDKGDTEHARLRTGIRGEYHDIKSGYSSLYGFLRDAQAIITGALSVVKRRNAMLLPASNLHGSAPISSALPSFPVENKRPRCL
jgi:hypothetical protein